MKPKKKTINMLTGRYKVAQTFIALDQLNKHKQNTMDERAVGRDYRILRPGLSQITGSFV